MPAAVAVGDEHDATGRRPRRPPRGRARARRRVTPGRSPGRIEQPRSPVAASRASWRAGLRPRDRCSTRRAPAAAATSQDLGIGRDDEHLGRPRASASAAAIVRPEQQRSTRSRRSSASSTAPRRDFAPSNARTGIATVVARGLAGGHGRLSGSGTLHGSMRRVTAARTSRGEPGARRVVGHDRVGHDGPEAERLDRRGRAASTVSSTNTSTRPAYSRATPRARRLVAERDEHPVRRALERLAADDRARPPRPGTPRARAAAMQRRACPGTSRIGPTETSGFDGRDDDRLGRLERREHLGRRRRAPRCRRTAPRARRAPGAGGRSTPGTRASRPRSGPRSRPASSVIGRIRAAIPSAACAPRQTSVRRAPARSRAVRTMCSARSRSPSRNHVSSP